MLKVTPVYPAAKVKPNFQQNHNEEFQNILKNKLDIDSNQVYDTETNETICDIDNMDEETLNKLLKANPIEYDRLGRMRYNPIFHSRTGQQWTQSDLDYITQWYDKIGPDEISYALERTIKSVMTKATELKKKGKMLRIQCTHHRRAHNAKC